MRHLWLEKVGARGCYSARRPTRGFTLIEVIVVVVIISILAVIAIPAVTARMRDRRTNQAAHQVAALYRNARMRAMGRGSSVLVRYTTNGAPRGRIEVREAILGGDTECATLPASGCLTNSWGPAGVGENADNQLITEFDPGVRGEFKGVKILMRAPGDTSPTGGNVDVCFTPLGAAYVSSGVNGLRRMAGVWVAEVSRDGEDDAQVGLMRSVMVLPNGTARLGI